MRRGRIAGLAIAVACTALRDTGGASAQRAALRHLFRDRAHDRALVLWADASRAGPVFEALGEPPAPPVAGTPADTSLGSVVALRGHDLDTLFRAHPDGWAAFFAQHPGATGLLEVARAVRHGDTATVLVGRACGEH
ncbi:MAG: hypothetical protein JO180_07585, partial [Gemmatirosa sp.]|nr:hypothetical protein [Gemmatirosa sp.]